MSGEEEFLQQSANKFLSEIYDYQIVDNDPAKKEALRNALFDKLREYDSEFYKRYNKVPLSDLANEFKQQQNFRELPDQSVIQHNLMRNTFVSDAGYLTRYQRLHKMTTTNPATQPLNIVEPPAQPERNYENEFIDTRYHFKDTNLNQKAYLSNPNLKVNSNIGERDQYLNELELNSYQQNLLTLMKQPQIIGEDAQPLIVNHNKKIEMLGGIEDTVGAMERSLNEMQQASQQPKPYLCNLINARLLNSNLNSFLQKDGLTYTQRPVNVQTHGGHTDTFLKDYSQKVGSTNSVVEKSKQMREQMMKRIQQN